MAYIVVAYILMAYIVMAYAIMAYIVMAYVVMACERHLGADQHASRADWPDGVELDDEVGPDGLMYLWRM